MTNPKYRTQSETTRIFDVFKTFNQDAQETRSPLEETPDIPHQSILTMSSLGQLGRFGNQLFQYAFLRICASKTDSVVQCPPWIGQTLFGHEDAPISQRLEPAIESKDGVKILFDVIPEFIPYLEKLAGTKSRRIDSKALEQGVENVDLWGFFQFPTHLLAPYKPYIRSLFQPVSDLRTPLEAGLEILRSKGKTIVGIHIRKGDFVTQTRAGFTLVFPERWYCEWLEQNWNDLEDPVLFLCSDDIDRVLPQFKQYSPITSRELQVKLPDRMKDLEIDFYDQHDLCDPRSWCNTERGLVLRASQSPEGVGHSRVFGVSKSGMGGHFEKCCIHFGLVFCVESLVRWIPTAVGSSRIEISRRI